MSTKRLLIALMMLSFASLLVWPATAEAQRRGPAHRPGGRSIGVIRGGFGSPGGRIYSPQYPWGRYGPWGPWPRQYYYTRNDYLASVRIEAQPKNAEVYVDGSLAGIVDDFDGVFQQLNLRAGDHEIALYLEGYRTMRHRMYFAPFSAQRIKVTMEKVAPGESSGPRPQPAPPPAPETKGLEQPRAPNAPPPPPEPPAQPARFGTLSIKVLPAEAEIVVDDQHWTGPSGEQRLAIKLSAGRHHIEVKKEGFAPYVEDVLIRSDAAMTLNVSLTKK